jgi:hypothetical protein
MYITRSAGLKLGLLCIALLLILTACGSTASQAAPQPTVTVDQTFQSQISPIPTVPTYRCGAWSSDNAPGPSSTIIIFARLTKNITGVPGVAAIAIVHFQSGNQQLDQNPISDSGGYVSFTLPLQGRQTTKIPATVDVIFTNQNLPGGMLHCTPAFFTPT